MATKCLLKENFDPRLIVIGPYWLWGYCSFTLPSMLVFGGTSEMLVHVNEASLAGLVVALVLMIGLGKWVLPLIVRKDLMIADTIATSAFTLLCALFMSGPAASSVIFGTLSGMTSAWMVCVWAMVYGWSEPRSVGVTSQLVMLTIALLLCALSLAPRAVGLVVAVAAPPTSCVFLRGKVPHNLTLSRVRPLPARKLVMLMGRFLGTVATVGLCVAFLQMLLGSSAAEQPPVGSPLFFLGVASASLAQLAIGLARGMMPSSEGIYRVVLPIMLAAMLSITFLSGSLLGISMYLLGAGFCCFDLCTLVLVTDATSRTRVSPVLSLGVTRIAIALGMLAGSILGSMVQVGTATANAFAALVSIVMVIAGTGAFSHVDVIGAPGVPSSGVSARKNASPAVARSEKADGIAQAWGLTSRETEVLRLLLDGREAPQIAQELMLTSSTVRTHIRHIYDKLGVHNRQELYDVVDHARF